MLVQYLSNTEMQYPKSIKNRLPRYRNIPVKSQILQYLRSGTSKIHEIHVSWKISIYWLHLSLKGLKLVEFLACRAMQYYNANAIFTGQTKPKSIFPKPPSPTSASAPIFTTNFLGSCFQFLCALPLMDSFSWNVCGKIVHYSSYARLEIWNWS